MRDCSSAMESIIKILGNDDEIKNASKILRNSKKWGLDDIVKDGYSIFNNLHRLYPDFRHGTRETSTMSINEAKYWVERISTYILYMVREHEVSQNDSNFITNKQDVNIVHDKLQESVFVTSNAQNNSFEEKEIALLGVILSLQNTPNSGVPISAIKKQMNHNGFDNIDVNLSIRKLIKKGFIYHEVSYEPLNNYESYEVNLYFIADDSEEWLLENSEKLKVKINNSNKVTYNTSNFDDDELSF